MAKRVFTKVNLSIYFIFLLAFALISVGAAIGVYNYFGHSLPNNDVTQKLEDKLTYGSSVTVDEVLKNEACDYGWITADDVIIEVFSTNNKGESELTQEVLEYSKEDGTFKVVGIASGMIKFTSGFDNTVNFTVTFTTKFKSSDTKDLLESNYSKFAEDGIFTKTELSQVETIIISNKPSVDLVDFELLKNLKRLEIVQIPNGKLISITNFNIPSSTNIYVETKQYLKYVNSKESIWRNNTDRIFPTVINLNAHSVVLYKNEGVFANDDGDSIATFEVEDGNTFDLSTFFAIEKQGYQFLGWYTKDGNNKIGDTHVFNSDIKLYAKWEANTYTIRLHSNDGTGRYVDNDFEYDENKRINKGSFVYDGFTQIGWAYDPNATEVVFLPNALVVNLTDVNDALIEVYAIWIYDKFTIEFYNWDNQKELVKYGESKEGHINQSFTLDVNVGKPISLYGDFVGWAFNPDAPKAEYEYGEEVPFSAVQEMLTSANQTAVIRFYALYMLTKYNLTYDANGGDGSGLENLENLPRGELVTISKPIEKEGYKFKGWLDNAGHLWVSESLYAKDEEYYASYANNNLLQVITEDEEGWITPHGMEFVQSEEAILTAVWQANTFNVVFEGDQTDSKYYKPATVTYGVDYKFSGEISKVGHERTSCVSNYGNVSMSDRTLTADQVITIYNALKGTSLNNEFDCSQTVTFTVSWKPIAYKIKYVLNGGTLGNNTDKWVVYGTAYGSLPTPSRGNSGYCSKGCCYTYYTFNGWYYNGKSINANTIMWAVPTSGNDYISIAASWSSSSVTKKHSSCFTNGTMITMADGSKKAIENIAKGDMLLALNHNTGELGAFPATLFIHYNEPWNTRSICELTFDDGTILKIVEAHSLFDKTLNCYVKVACSNVEEFLNHDFYSIRNVNGEFVRGTAKLVSYRLYEEFSGTYTLLTAYAWNIVAEGILSAPSGGDICNTEESVEYGLLNIFSFNEDLSWNQEEIESAVALYGLNEYSDYSEYMSERIFDMFNVKYFKIMEAKGIIDTEVLLNKLKAYSGNLQ